MPPVAESLAQPLFALPAPGGSNHSSRKFLWRSGIKCQHHRAASRPVHFLADRAALGVSSVRIAIPWQRLAGQWPGDAEALSNPVEPGRRRLRRGLRGVGQQAAAQRGIKRLKNAQGAHSVLREAQLAASLQHAAFVKIYALEDDDASPSIVMELVRGQTLKQFLADARPTARQALAMVRQVAGAMREAHESGLVHGDLKPSNLMVEPSGTVRILDFGLATQDDAQATTSLQNADPQGTIAYMAPERLLGGSLRAQSDIYALGVVFYELLTGSRPFAHLSGLALAAAHIQSSSEAWPFPASADLAPAWVQLIQAMTASSVERRLATMTEVCERMAALAADTTQTLSPASVPASALAEGATLAAAAADVSGALPAPAASPAAAPSASASLSSPRQRLAWAAGLTVLLAAGGWWSVVSAPSLAQLYARAAPYSEALEMQRGVESLKSADRAGEVDAAERRFTTILSHSPDNAAAVAGMSLVYSLRYLSDNQDEIWRQKGAAAAQQALKLNGQLALAHVAQAKADAVDGKRELALQGYARALALDPNNIFAVYGKADTLRMLHRYDDALAAARAAALRYPRERVFADEIGIIAYAQGDYPAAEQAFRASIALQPDAVFAYANLSAALLSQNRQDEALQVLQQGLQVRPSAWLYGNLGNALFLRDDYVGAAAAFEAAVSGTKGNPANYLGWANLGDALLWIPGRESQARAAYAQAIALLSPRLMRTPDDVTLVSRQALYMARIGDKAACASLLQHALQLAPETAYVQFRAGLTYELIGDRPHALAAIIKAEQLGHPLKFIEAAPELVALRRDPVFLNRAPGLAARPAGGN